jgi:metal-responsive CopG/Arc/MetJ family transcriptional regulator
MTAGQSDKDLGRDLVQVPMRLPRELVDEIDARMHKVGERSRNAWLERALRWALTQEVRTRTVRVEEKT